MKSASFACTEVLSINKFARSFVKGEDWTPKAIFSKATVHYIVGDASEIKELCNFLASRSPKLKSFLNAKNKEFKTGDTESDDGEDSDARKAYTQALLSEFEGDTETWIEIPPELWPPWWKSKFRRPCVRLLRNLYGHPLAGLFWEKHCEKSILSCGFQKIQGWECMYAHPKHQAFLSVYVDDFKMAGPAGNLPAAWASIAQIKMEKPTTVGRFLGCNHAVHDLPDQKGIE